MKGSHYGGISLVDVDRLEKLFYCNFVSRKIRTGKWMLTDFDFPVVISQIKKKTNNAKTTLLVPTPTLPATAI